MARSLDGTTTHYHTLGVAPDAPPAEVRRAYHALARALHPDRHVNSAPADAEAATERMRQVNAAWQVLSDRGARELYDLELNLAARRADPSSPVVGGATGPRSTAGAGSRTGAGAGAPRWAGPTAPPGPPTRGQPLFRGFLWLTVLGVLAFIFVFTAYAASSGNDRGTSPAPSTTATTEPEPLRTGECVRVADQALDVVECSAPHDYRVADVVPVGRPCPGVSQEIYLPGQRENACLDVG